MRMVKKECEPTLTDQQIIQFCRDGYMEFPGAVSKDITDRALDYVAENPDYAMQPVPLLNESWFTDGLIFAPVVAGAVRSLLGAGFGLPWMMANHIGKCPDANPLGWHVDGGNMHTWALNYLQVFCLMQDTTEEMGPTEVLPGSHFILGQSALVTRYGAIRGTKKCVGPVGTVFLTCYPIWHRRSKATATGTTRHLFKYNYVRNSPPTRDWIIEPDFNPSCDTHAFSHLQTGATMLRRNKLDNYDAAHMYLWLCGRQEEMRYVGGVAWPMLDDMIGGQTEEVYGAPPSLSATPDAWRPEAPPI